MKPNYFLIPFAIFVTAIIGSAFTSAGMDWYKTLHLPSWTPPGAIIGTVWTILFILATISALLVWNKTQHGRLFKWTIAIFLLNAVLNIGWSFVFFYSHQMYLAIWESALLGMSVLLLIILIWRVHKIAASLLVPYLLWVSFATYLTYSVWRLNS